MYVYLFFQHALAQVAAKANDCTVMELRDILSDNKELDEALLILQENI